MEADNVAGDVAALLDLCRQAQHRRRVRLISAIEAAFDAATGGRKGPRTSSWGARGRRVESGAQIATDVSVLVGAGHERPVSGSHQADLPVVVSVDGRRHAHREADTVLGFPEELELGLVGEQELLTVPDAIPRLAVDREMGLGASTDRSEELRSQDQGERGDTHVQPLH
jgi:hypothetical protein